MKITIKQLRRIIKEETQRVILGESKNSSNSKRRLSESHARITQEEFAAWKNGDWGFVSEEHSTGMPAYDNSSSRFLHGDESGHPVDDEGYMLKRRMLSMVKMAQEICNIISEKDQFPAWVQDLVATSHGDVQHVYDYLMGDVKMHQGNLQQPVMPMSEFHNRNSKKLL